MLSTEDADSCQPRLDVKIKEVFYNNKWNLPEWFSHNFPAVSEEIQNFTMGSSDSLIWPFSISGEITTKNAYYFLAGSDNGDMKLSFWEYFIPPSRSTLIWRIWHGRLPTEISLSRRGIYLTSCCRLCYRGEDSITHLFTQCQFGNALWDLISSWFRKTVRFSAASISGFIEDNLLEVKKNQVDQLWKAAFISVFWIIWKIRNDIIFNNKGTSLHQAMAATKICVLEAAKLCYNKIRPGMDDFMILKNLGITPNPPKDHKIIEIRWALPPPACVKVNTDGSSFGSPGLAGSAGIFRNSRGFILGCFALPIGVAYAFEAEMVALIQAINIAWRRNWHWLWIETDCTYVLHMANTKSMQIPWRWRNLWADCIRQMDKMTVHITHIY